MTVKELVEIIEVDRRAYELVNSYVFDHQTEAELNRRSTLASLQKRIRNNAKDLLTLLSKELNEPTGTD